VVKEKETPQVGGEGGGFWVTRVRQREEAEKQSLLVSSSSSFSFFCGLSVGSSRACLNFVCVQEEP
jgi:hypothetical protein